MPSRRKSGAEVGRRASGAIVAAVGLMLGLALISYDWRDVGLLCAAPNRPPNNLVGPVGAWCAFGLLMVLGVAAYLIPLGMVGWGLQRVWKTPGPRASRIAWGVAWFLSVTALADLTAPLWRPLTARLNLYDAGGAVGRILVQGALVRWLSTVGTAFVVGAWFVMSLAFWVGPERFGKMWTAVGRWVRETIPARTRKRRSQDQTTEAEAEEMPSEEIELIASEEPPPPAEEPPSQPAVAQTPPSLGGSPSGPPERVSADRLRPPEGEKRAAGGDHVSAEKKTAAVLSEVSSRAEASAYQLPPLSLLDPVPPVSNGARLDVAAASEVLLRTLREFGIEAQIVRVEEGPTVTSFQIVPALGVRVERIVGLSQTIAMALKAQAVRVQAPIPGKGVVGIEVPNAAGRTVYLREMVESEAWRPAELQLPLIIGKDVSGTDIVADLTEMPHLLVAGSTGSGKTVCLNTFLAGLLLARTPDELRLLLIDPKRVEFGVYNDLPHLVAPVVTNPDKVVLALRWAIREMDRRYRLLARNNVRDIQSFNRRSLGRQGELFESESQGGQTESNAAPQRLPYLVIIIDELADLMRTTSGDVEHCIARLAQLSRAVGIHMILATQRPSVDVVTGTIKANFPSRIAFQVAQKVDSRTILDAIGAENLLRKGDMLFLPAGGSKLIRAQGAKTSPEELSRIVEFIKRQAEPRYELVIHGPEEESEEEFGEAGEGEPDEAMLRRALRVIRETRRASTSSLQRRLKIGYTRAGRIMDILEDRGIVGPPRGSEPREILVDLDGPIPGFEDLNDETEEVDHGTGGDAS